MLTSSPVILRWPKSSGTFLARATLARGTPSPPGSTSTACSPVFSRINRCSRSAVSRARSTLLMTKSTGFSSLTNRSHHCHSFSYCFSKSPSPVPSVADNKRIAKSALSAANRVFSTRSLPSFVVSSNPGVSITTQAPMGEISIGLYTGSVVVPTVSDTMDTCCMVRAFKNVDFPLFVFPNIPMCSRSAPGVSFILPHSLKQSFSIQNPSPDIRIFGF